MQRQQYLDYFNNTKKKPSSKNVYNHNNLSSQSRSLHLNNSRVQRKILPHISEQYQYKITNQLLVDKIMNPKRDKLIIESFHKDSSRPGTRQAKSREQTTFYLERQPQSLDMERRQEYEMQQHNSLHSRTPSRQNTLKLRHKTIKSHQKQFNLALQNQRMGRRIIKTKSSVQQILKKTFFTYKSNQFNKQNQQKSDLKNSFIRVKDNRKVYFSGKINNGVKVFFNPVRDQQRSLSRSKSVHNQGESEQRRRSNQNSNGNFEDDQNNTYYNNNQHKGQLLRKTKTTANLRSRFIKSSGQHQLQNQHMIDGQKHIETHHPESFKIFGKGPTILMLHNLEITCNPPLKPQSILILELVTHQKRITIRHNKEKSIRTSPIAYEFLKPSSEGSLNCIRFAINVSQIGDFVPLRIYKVNGVEIQELGIIDVDLAAFRYRKEEIGEETNGTLVKQYKVGKDGERKEREIVSGSVSGKLRKNLLNKPVETIVSLGYKIYSKKYRTVKNVK